MLEVPCKLGTPVLKLHGSGLVFELDCVHGPNESGKKAKKAYKLTLVLDTPQRLNFISSLLKLFDAKTVNTLRGATCLALVDEKSKDVLGLKQFEFDGGIQVTLNEFLTT